MDSVLVRFHGKNYYVKYSDLLNKANDKLFAYEDEGLTKIAKLDSKILMFNKKDIEDKMKKDIKMPTRMPSNLATEEKKVRPMLVKFQNKNYYVNYDDLLDKNAKKLWAYEDVGLTKLATIGGLHLMFNKDDMEEKLRKNKNDFDDIRISTPIKDSAKMENSIKKKKLIKNAYILNPNGVNKMTKEEKLRKYIREQIIKILKEDIDTRTPSEVDIVIPGAADSNYDREDDVKYISSQLKRNGINAKVSYSIDEYYIMLKDKSQITKVKRVLNDLGYQYYSNIK